MNLNRACCVIALLSILLCSGAALAANGLVTVQSSHSVAETGDRLEKVLAEKGMTVMARINHAAGAEKAGMDLPATELVIFGNPKVGTPLMQCSRTVAIDLPQKALIWEDAEGQVWLAYNDPEYLGARHDLGEACAPVLAKVSKALAAFAAAATGQ